MRDLKERIQKEVLLIPTRIVNNCQISNGIFLNISLSISVKELLSVTYFRFRSNVGKCAPQKSLKMRRVATQKKVDDITVCRKIAKRIYKTH